MAGDRLVIAAHHYLAPEELTALEQAYPQPLDGGAIPARAVVERSVIHILDAQAVPRNPLRELPHQVGFRTTLQVPLLKEDVAVGVLSLWRRTVSPFSEPQIELLKTFADQAVIAIENVRLFTETKEALEQQTATSEILRVISRSQTDIQPVFDAISQSAVGLCGGDMSSVFRFDGDLIHWLAGYNVSEQFTRAYPMPIIDSPLAARTIIDRSVVEIADIETDHRASERGRELARGLYRALLLVPMSCDGVTIGAIGVARRAAGRFSDKQIALLRTFADQAVIAIENVRLFTELQQKNEAVTQAHAQVSEALEQQTATSEILRVISSSPTDVQPVFDAIAEMAHRLCRSLFSAVFRFDGQLLHLAAHHNFTVAAAAAYHNVFPAAPSRYMIAGRAILDRAVAYTSDIEAGAIESGASDLRKAARTLGVRSILSVPMLRSEEPLGCITVFHRDPIPFSQKQIALLQTFADQAVIAIENVRLFTELQTSNRELTTALDTQTATSDILRVISRSQADVQPVFDTILASAVRLLEGYHGALTRVAGDQIELAALTSPDDAADAALRAIFPQSLHSEGPHPQAICNRAPINTADTETDPRWPEAGRAVARARGYRSLVVVPMLRHEAAVGTIAVARREAGGFTDAEIALLQTFADQAVIAIENARLLNELQDKNASLTEALEQQTATSEILRVISRSQTDVQPVFDTIVRSAVRLCDGLFSALYRFDGELIQHGAQYNYSPEALEAARRVFPAPPTRGQGVGRAILERAVIHIPDVDCDPEFQLGDLTRAIGMRSGLFVPMLREGTPIGVIAVARAAPGPFSDTEIELLKTFADQAVIAVENVRLFTELQTSNRELTTALDTQTATSDILRVISRSQTDVQPVFDAIVDSAVRLLRAYSGALTRIAGDQIALAAHTSTDDAGDAAQRAFYPQPLHSEGTHARALRDRAPLNIVDAYTDPRVSEGQHANARIRGYRSQVVVPMLRHDEAVGTISVTRREPGGFTDDEIALLQTFADQAVIAIENARLLRELQQRNEALTQAHAQITEALEQQMATGDILRVIASSPTDIQPVFETIAQSASRLLGRLPAGVYRYDGELIHQIALAAESLLDHDTLQELRRAYPMRPGDSSATSRAILTGQIIRVSDIYTDPQHHGRSGALHFRRALSVPMLRDTRVIGTITVAGFEAGDFSENEIALLQTFADQAVIAIENVRLFTELQARTDELTRSVEQLTALGEVGRAVSSTLDLETVLTTIVSRAVELSGLDGGVVFEYDEREEAFIQRAATEQGGPLAEARRATRIQKGEGVVGRTAITLEPVQVPDISAPGAYESRLRENLIASGVRAILAVPMVREDRLIGNLVVTRNRPGEFLPGTIELLRTFSTQSALAIQNARLFREIEIKSRELEVASQHKSEFLASMSHELRTPLNAIIGFSDVLLQGMFGEMSDKQTEYLQDILASGQHLLSLINDILDLSKIEAGRMELDLAAFDLPSAIDDALLLMRERAGRRGITLERHIDERVGEIRGDQRKVKQVLLNLLSNAVKFTPEGGRIDVRAGLANGTAEISVTDSGIGIAPEDHDAVFEEFRQVGRADKKAEGTGLGLALCRKFVELHGGRIWVKSEIGAGSTFTFTLPVSR